MPDTIPQTMPNEHVLEAALMFQHPVSGLRYYGVCEKRNGSNQDFVVYRRAEGQTNFDHVFTLDGQGRDADSQVTMGGGMITRDGSLEVWASGDPTGVEDNSGTGFMAIGAVVPGVDLPWAIPAATNVVLTGARVKLNPPRGYRPYGANQSIALSSETVDGLPVYFIAQQGWGYSPDNEGFGEYVFRQVGDHVAEYIYYKGADVMDGRGDLYVFGNGQLYISGNESDGDKLPSFYRVDGFRPFGSSVYLGGGSATGGGATSSALELKVANLEGQLSAVRQQASDALARANYVKSIVDDVWEVVGALEDRPVGLTKDEVWVLASQAVYADMQNPLGGIAGQVRLIAGLTTGTVDLKPIADKLIALEESCKTKVDAEQSTQLAANVAATLLQSSVFASRVKGLATEVLVAAIDYAKTVARGSTTSRLRVLIEAIIKGN